MSPRPARKSCFVKPWLLNITARGGPEIVVTEYSTPRPPPNTSPTRRSSLMGLRNPAACSRIRGSRTMRSEEHTSELQSHSDLVCRLLLEKKKKKKILK